MQHNIFAFTDAGFAPQFLSVNHDGEGRYEVIARSAPMGDEVYGNTAVAVLNLAQLKDLTKALYKELFSVPTDGA